MAMRESEFTWVGFMLRFVAGLVLVFATYNPSGYSYFHWVRQLFPSIGAVQAFSGVLLVIGWAIYVRASLRSLGAIGLLLTAALFGTLFWLIIDLGWIPVHNVTAMVYVALVLLALVLGTGLSWSHIRRRLSGQLDTDET
jgi:hypothetical protein